MALYNNRGKIQYLDLDEIAKFLSTYLNVRDRIIMLNWAKSISARSKSDVARYLLDKGIPEARKLPEEIKNMSNDTIIIHDADLSKLEKKCGEILKRKK